VFFNDPDWLLNLDDVKRSFDVNNPYYVESSSILKHYRQILLQEWLDHPMEAYQSYLNHNNQEIFLQHWAKHHLSITPHALKTKKFSWKRLEQWVTYVIQAARDPSAPIVSSCINTAILALQEARRMCQAHSDDSWCQAEYWVVSQLKILNAYQAILYNTPLDTSLPSEDAIQNPDTNIVASLQVHECSETIKITQQSFDTIQTKLKGKVESRTEELLLLQKQRDELKNSLEQYNVQLKILQQQDRERYNVLDRLNQGHLASQQCALTPATFPTPKKGYAQHALKHDWKKNVLEEFLSVNNISKDHETAKLCQQHLHYLYAARKALHQEILTLGSLKDNIAYYTDCYQREPTLWNFYQWLLFLSKLYTIIYGKDLYLSQLLCIGMSFQHKTPYVYGLKTGQGKSIVAAMLMAMFALHKKQPDALQVQHMGYVACVTSDPSVSKRDHQDATAFFSHLGLHSALHLKDIAQSNTQSCYPSI
jgi:hypothetical protein